MTEDEAKTKRCPMSFSGAGMLSHDGSYVSAHMGGLGSGGMAVATTPTHCIASGCMMWVVPDLEHPGRGCCGLAGGNQRF